MAVPSRTWRVMNLDMGVGEPERVVLARAASAAGVDPSVVRACRIARRSVDARRRGKSRRLRFIVHADLTLDASYSGARFDAAVRAGRVVEAPRPGTFLVERPARTDGRVVVVGSGPAGLYTALVLALNGVAVD